MDSEAWLTFLAVHRAGGVSAAALALSRTQSAISRRLAVLEGQVGVPLFDRVGRQLRLSDAGAALLPHAERIAAAVGDAEAAARSARRGDAGSLRLVVVGTLADAGLTAVLQRLRDRFPSLDLRLHTATSAEVSAQVRAGQASLGLRYLADRDPALDSRIVQHEPLVVACGPAHPLAGRRVKRLAALADERWLGFPAPAGRVEAFASSIAAQFQSRGIADLDWLAIDSLTAQKRLVEAGFGLALMQAGAIDEERAAGRLAVITVDDLDVSVPVALLRRRGGHLGEAAQWLCEALAVAPAPALRRRKGTSR